jgi:glycosyltransferase involved in cell wall biosynthesis
MTTRPAPKAFRVGFAGTFQPYHGVDVLLGAARLLPEAEFTLVGDGPGLGTARENAPMNVSFLGQRSREETLSLLADSSVLAIPAGARAMYPVKLLEYAALARPIVCPDQPAYDEFDTGSARGALRRFQAGSPEALAEALQIAASSSDSGANDALRTLVRERYTWEAVGRRLADRLAALVES